MTLSQIEHGKLPGVTLACWPAERCDSPCVLIHCGGGSLGNTFTTDASCPPWTQGRRGQGRMVAREAREGPRDAKERTRRESMILCYTAPQEYDGGPHLSRHRLYQVMPPD